MKFLYCVKGCSHCDSREDCPIELKRSDQNLLDSPRTIEEAGGLTWVSYCSDFYREVR